MDYGPCRAADRKDCAQETGAVGLSGQGNNLSLTPDQMQPNFVERGHYRSWFES